MARNSALLLLAFASFASADSTKAPYALQLWNDPAFKRHFLREYAPASDIEPPVNDLERQQLEKLRPFMAEKPAECLQALSEVTTDRSSAEFDFILGQLSTQTGQPVATSLSHYQAAVTKFPNFRRAHFALGRIFTQDGKYEIAIRSLAKAMELGKADAVLFGLLGFCHLALDHTGSAESAYRTALVMQPESVDWKMGLVRALLKQGKADEVIAFCDEMIAADPKKAELWMLQSNAFITKKDFSRAATNLEMAARYGNPSAQDFQRLGDIYLNEQLSDAALSAYDRALSHAVPLPLNDAIRVVEGCVARGALAQGKELLGMVRTRYASGMADSDKPRLMKIEARIAVADGQGGKSIEILEEVVRLDPLDGDALMLVAQHYGATGEKEKAILFYQRAEGIEAFEADASTRHAQLLAGMGKVDQAIPLLKLAQQLKPRDSVAKFLEELERYQKQRR